MIIIGYNEGWKQNINIGKRNTQNFVSVPFLKLIHQIQYKSEMVGMSVKCVSEAYTSQTCSVCGVIDNKNRLYRGLYICSHCQTVMNADTNAATNILHQEFSKSSVIGYRGSRYHPVKLKI